MFTVLNCPRSFCSAGGEGTWSWLQTPRLSLRTNPAGTQCPSSLLFFHSSYEEEEMAKNRLRKDRRSSLTLYRSLLFHCSCITLPQLPPGFFLHDCPCKHATGTPPEQSSFMAGVGIEQQAGKCNHSSSPTTPLKNSSSSEDFYKNPFVKCL